MSFYERARLAPEAAKLGLYPTPWAATAALFTFASPAKRSKIGSFVRIHDELGEFLRFPAAISERVGLALAAASEARGAAARLADRLTAAAPEEIAPGLRLEVSKGRVVLSGKAVTAELRSALEAWLRQRQG